MALGTPSLENPATRGETDLLMTHPSAPITQSILIVAGEASGEMYAAELVGAIKARSENFPFHFFGSGGAKMRQEGVEILVDIHRLAVVGPFEAFSHFVYFYAALRLLRREVERRRPCLAILVDFPDFNLRLAKELKALRIPVVYFISPQVWAWRSGRVHQMKELIDHLLVILPFEKDFYAGFGMAVDYIGHPLVDRVRTSCSRNDFFEKYGLSSEVATVSLLPGSRTKEIKYNLPVLLQTAQRLNREQPIQFLLPLATTIHRRLIQDVLAEETPRLPLRLIAEDTYNAVGHSDVAVVASGTATLEAAILGIPLIPVFRISNLTWIVGQYLVRVPFYSLVNLIAGKEIVPELFQNEFNADRLYDEIRKYLADSTLRKRVKMELSLVKEKLGDGGAVEKAVERIMKYIGNEERSGHACL
jgi:lipid-A-disaccharide synthase